MRITKNGDTNPRHSFREFYHVTSLHAGPHRRSRRLAVLDRPAAPAGGRPRPGAGRHPGQRRQPARHQDPRAGTRRTRPPPLPAVLGWMAAGVVEAVGPGCDGLASATRSMA
ncbi:hypothetical protein ACU4GD_03800 [Cupriavidus basilensis]